MDETVNQGVAKDPLFDDVMDVIYNEVPRSVLADMMNTDNMIIRNGGSASLEPHNDALGHPTPSQQYHTQGIGSCSDQMFSKGVGNKNLELMGGHDEVRSDFVKTCILSTEETGSAGHRMSSCNDQITQSAFNDLIAYLKDPGLKTDGHFDGISNNIEASTRQFGHGSETPSLPQTVVTHNHVTMATEGRATGRSRNKNSQAGHCDEALVRKREQNKKAAKKCRDKKLQSLKDLEQAAFQAHMTFPPHRQTIPPTTGAASQRVAQDSQCGQITSVAPQNVAPFGQTCGTVTEQMLIDIINVVANPVSSGTAVSSMQPDVAQSDTKDHTKDHINDNTNVHTHDNTMSMSLNNSYAAIQNGGSNLPVLSQLTELAQRYDCPVGTNGELMDTGQTGLMSSQGPDALETIQLHDMATIRDPTCAVEESNIDLGTPDASRSMQTRSQTRNRVRRTRSRVSESSMDETSQEFKEYLKTLDPKERKRVLNRLAAKRCRDKKYEKELELEAKARQLREQRSELLRVKAQLQEESKSIATNLRQHAYCLRR